MAANPSDLLRLIFGEVNFYGYINFLPFLRLSIRLLTKNTSPFSGRYPPTNVCQLFLDGCQRLLVEVRVVMKVLSQVSTIPDGPEKKKLVLYCSYKRTAAQYLAISLLSQKTLPSVTKPPGVGQVSHRQWASG